MTPGTGLVQCHWSPSFSFEVPDVPSGLFVVRLSQPDGVASFVPLVVHDARRAALMFQASVNTWQAYNPWGGESFYIDRTKTLPGGAAVRVSFDRPYAEGRGTGQLLRWEAPFAAFLERYGYDVTYVTNFDVAAQGSALVEQAKAFLSVGHDEYWTGEERTALHGARRTGHGLLFFGANAAYWKVRLDAPGPEDEPRIITCFKSNPEQDPDRHTGERTGQFRSANLAQPENELLGAMYESYVHIPAPWVVTAPNHFLYEGTGLHAGDGLPFLVGYEYDRTASNGGTPPGAEVVARTPILDVAGRMGLAESVIYRARSGALVFDAGTMDWAKALRPGESFDPRIARMTANVIAAAGGGPVPEAITDLAMAAPGPVSVPAAHVRLVAKGLEAPMGLAVLSGNSLVVAEQAAHRISVIGPTGVRRVLAGDGKSSSDPSFDDVPADRARFFAPTGVAALPTGEIFVADTFNHCIRRIDPGGLRQVRTIAGRLGVAGFADGTGTDARFFRPTAIAVDPQTSDLYVADSHNHAIRRVAYGTWAVTTIAGTGVAGSRDGPGAEALFSFPSALATTPDGRVFVVTSGEPRIAVIAPDATHTVTTLVHSAPGRRDGRGTEARIAPQGGAAWDGEGLLFSEPATNVVRRLVPGPDPASSRLETFVGTGRLAQLPESPDELALPLGLAVFPDGRVAISSAGDGSLRMATP